MYIYITHKSHRYQKKKILIYHITLTLDIVNMCVFIVLILFKRVYIYIYVPLSKVAILGMVIPPLIGIIIMGI